MQIICPMVISATKIRSLASQVGFLMCGIAPVRALTEQKSNFAQWLDAGYDSGIGYLRRNADMRFDPSLLFEGAKSVIVCVLPYKNAVWDQRQDSGPKISSYAITTDYHTIIKGMLTRLLGLLQAEYPELRARCFTDSAPILEKTWAIEAGLGWRGKNSLVVTPQFGSFVFLGELVTDAQIDTYDSPFSDNPCGSCTACIDACPNTAIRSPYIVDTARCISRLTTEKLTAESDPNGRVPESAVKRHAATNDTKHEDCHDRNTSTFSCSQPRRQTENRVDTHGWIFGCDICQSVCPYNQRAPLATDPAFASLFDPRQLSEGFWDNLDENTFKNLFGGTPVARTGYSEIKRRAQEFFQRKSGEKEDAK